MSGKEKQGSTGENVALSASFLLKMVVLETSVWAVSLSI